MELCCPLRPTMYAHICCKAHFITSKFTCWPFQNVQILQKYPLFFSVVVMFTYKKYIGLAARSAKFRPIAFICLGPCEVSTFRKGVYQVFAAYQYSPATSFVALGRVITFRRVVPENNAKRVQAADLSPSRRAMPNKNYTSHNGLCHVHESEKGMLTVFTQIAGHLSYKPLEFTGMNCGT